MKTKLTLFVAVLFANCLLAVEMPDGISKDSKDPLVQAFIETKGDVIRAIEKVAKHEKTDPMIFDSRGRLIRINLNDINHNKLTDDAMILLSRISTLEKLELAGANISDAGLASLSELKNLKHLDLQSCSVTDKGLKSVAKLQNLEGLRLDGNDKVTNEGMNHLSACRQLGFLVITGCIKIDNSGLQYLLKLPKIFSLTASGTKITKEEFKAFKKKRPSVALVY